MSEVVSILKNPPGVSSLTLASPKAGEIYIYQSDDDTNQGMTASSIMHYNIHHSILNSINGGRPVRKLGSKDCCRNQSDHVH